MLFLGLSNSVSQFGDRLTHMVIITFIGLYYPGKVSAFSEFAITFSLPVIILAPFAGVFVDHANKQSLMFRCHLIQAILIFLTPSFIALSKSLIPIWILVFLFFALDIFNNTTKSAVIPDLVKYDELVTANSFVITLARIATFLGMVGGGYLIKWTGWRLGFYIDGTAHLIAGTLALFMGVRILFEPVKKLEFKVHREMRRALNIFLFDLKELGILLIKDRVVDFVMISVFILPFTAAVAYTVIIYLIQQEFGMGTTGVGWLGGIIGGGMFLGGILMGFLGKKISRATVIICSMGILATFFLVGPLFITPLFLYTIAFISGMVFSFIGISQDTILQEDVLKEIRGRIFATKEFIVNFAFLFCAIFIGFLARMLKPFLILRIVGVIIWLITLLIVIIKRLIPEEIRSKL